jgi:2Fe-2S ferredoxin
MTNKIHFTVIENNIKHSIETYHGEYRNLMYLLKDKLLLDEFGECGGIGRCGTCVIRAEGITGSSMIKERKEPTTLSKNGHFEVELRLSCQIYITKVLQDSVIEIV